jgi:hypothetical protein
LFPGEAVEIPSIHALEPVLGANLFPAGSLCGWRGSFPLVALDAGEELPLSLGVAPGVGLESPAADRLHEPRNVAVLAGLLISRVQVSVVTTEHRGVGVGG